MTPFTAPQELHDLAFRYALAVDNGDADALLALFTPDGAVTGHGENPIRFEGEAGLRQMIAQVTATFERTMHNVFNQLFWRLDDGSVAGMTYSVASHFIAGEPGEVLDLPTRYHNRYEERDGVWRYRERSLEILWVDRRAGERFSPAIMRPKGQ